jgi:putative ABC transport system substrate-binding protein
MNSRFGVIITLLLATVLLTIVSFAEAQQAANVPRIGFLSASGNAANPAMSERAFRQGLRDLGYVDGKNIIFEVRYAEGKRDRIPGLVAELVQLKVDLIATANLTAIRAAKAATKSIPIVMVTNADPVATS